MDGVAAAMNRPAARVRPPQHDGQHEQSRTARILTPSPKGSLMAVKRQVDTRQSGPR
jgi:hypothetical protein